MREAVIVEAVRTPIAKGKPGLGELSGLHAAKLLAVSVEGVLKKSGVEPAAIEQLFGGCVTQAGEQSNNLARNAWLTLGKEYGYAAAGSSMDVQCGSALQANNLMSAAVQAGSINVGIACGVESMSRVKLGSSVANGPGMFMTDDWPWDSPSSQFLAVERIAKNRGLTRTELDEFSCLSQKRAIAAWEAGHYSREVLSVTAPGVDDSFKPTGQQRIVSRDQGLRPTSLDSLASLKPVLEGGIHTAGNTSQISDGSAAVLWMTKEEALRRELVPRAKILADVVVGADPFYLLDGPVDATQAILKKTGMTLDDMDVIEINEAFATVVLSWARVFDPDMNKVNPNGGAIAIGHPVGSTGARLITSALHELERTDKSRALITMCCGSSIGVATIIERI